MPDLSKTASAALAALVVAVAATAASLVSSGTQSSGSGGPVASSSSSVTVSAAASSGSASGGVPARGHVALFLGRSPELKLRGGVAKSFACRGAVQLRWGCQVREGAMPTVPATLAADVVVVVLVPGDDVAGVSRLLDRLPARLREAPLVLLGPIAPAGGAPTAREAALRQLAAGRGGTYVDPVALQWIPAARRATFLAADGEHLTPAGRTQAAARLAQALSELKL